MTEALIDSPETPRSSSLERRLASWKVWLPLLLAGLALIATAFAIPIYRRHLALQYLDEQEVVYVFAPGREWVVEWFGDWATCMRSVQVVRLSNLSDAALSRLAALDELQLLSLCASPDEKLTTDGIRHLTAFSRLKVLIVPSTTYANEILASIAELSNLEVLRFTYGSELTEEGLRRLIQLPRLRSLGLPESAITPETIEILKQFPALDTLRVSGTRESELRQLIEPHWKFDFVYVTHGGII